MSILKFCRLKKICVFLILVTILVTTISFESYATNNSWEIAIKAKSNGKYVCADPNRQKLYANKTGVKTWETFTLIDLGNNQVALKAKSNGKYVCANPNGSPLVANKTWIKTWETFTLVSLGNNQVALKAKSNGKYVCADPKGRPLAANKTWIKTWETFTLGETGVRLTNLTGYRLLLKDNNNNPITEYLFTSNSTGTMETPVLYTDIIYAYYTTGPEVQNSNEGILSYSYSTGLYTAKVKLMYETTTSGTYTKTDMGLVTTGTFEIY